MNKFSLTLCICFSWMALSAQFVVWDDPIEVSLDGQDNNRPRIALNAEGNPLVIWGSDLENQIYFSRFEDGEFQNAEGLLPAGLECFTADWAGPEFDVDGDRVAVVFKRQPENIEGAYLMLSDDGGLSWGDSIRVDGIEAPDMQSRFPSVSLSGETEIHISFMEFEGNYLDPAYVHRRSNDNGETWSNLSNASTDLFAGEACDCCMSELVTTEEHVAVLYRNNEDNIRDIKVAVSTDAGDVFDLGLAPDNSSTYSSVCFSSGPVAATEGEELSMVYKITSGSDNFVRLTSLDLTTGEVSFNEDLHLAEWAATRQNNPRIARSGETFFVVWEASEGLATECMFACSVDGEEALINSADTLNVDIPGKQINPDVVLDGTIVHTVWQDRGNGRVMYRRGFIDPLGSGLAENLSGNIEVFPNPSQGLVSLKLESASSIEQLMVFDLMGRAVYCEEAIAAISLKELDLMHLEAGHYMMLTVVHGVVTTTRLCIQP